MIMALLLSIMMAMAGRRAPSIKALSMVWLPRYLSGVNSHGAPTRAMWTDLVFNLVVLSIACGGGQASCLSWLYRLRLYDIQLLNLNAGWIHRIDFGDIVRPYRAPTWLPGAWRDLRFHEAIFMGAGAKVWNLGRWVPARWRSAHIAGVLLSSLRTG